MADTSKERTIVIGMDGSDFSAYAFDWYVNHVHRENDKVIIVYSPEYSFVSTAPMGMTDPKKLQEAFCLEEERIKLFVEKLGDKLKHAGIGGKVKSQAGVAGHVIVEVAKEEGAHMIVTGCRGLGSIRRTFMGSVSDYVVHHSDVPVLVCRHKDHDHKHHKGKEEK